MLVRTPKPHATESLLGFVLRVSECNGYESPVYVFQLAQIPRCMERAPGFPVERLAKILGQDPPDLRRIAYRAEETSGRPFKILDHFLGETLRSVPLRLRRPAFCPQCVADEGYIDAFWDLTVAVACPTHRCEVMRSCAACGQPLTWRRPALLTCSCGASLCGAPPRPADRATSELMEIIKEKLHGRSAKSIPNTSRFPIEFLTDVPLESLLAVVQTLGAQALKARGVSPDAEGSAVVNAAETLAEWPSGYHRLLSMLGRRFLDEGSSAGGMATQFGPFYAMFKKRAFSGYTAFLREEFLEFGQLHWGNALIDRKRFRVHNAEGTQRFISSSEFVRRFCIGRTTLKRLIADGMIVSKTIKAGADTRTLIDVQSSQIPDESTGIINGRQAADRLGLPVEVLKCLREIQVFRSKPRRRGPMQSWHVDDIEAFRERALTLPLADGYVSGSETVPLKEVMQLKFRNTGAKADIVAAVFDGRLLVLGRSGGSLDGLLLDKVQVDDFVLQKKRQIEGDSYSLPQCAAATGLCPDSVVNALKAGLLDECEHGGRVRVTAKSVERFKSEYVPLTKIAKRLGSSTARMRRICRNVGLPIVTVPRKDHPSPQPLLLRTDEQRLLALWWKAKSQGRRYVRVDAATVHEKSLGMYLKRLRANAKRLPRRAGRPNNKAILKACNLPHNAFRLYPFLARVLEDFDKRERELGQVERDGYSLSQCAAMTGLSLDAVPNALKAGLLEGREYGGRVRITDVSVERFKSEYIPLSKMAMSLGSSARGIRRICGDAGVPIVAVPREEPSSPQFLLHRTDEQRVIDLWGRKSQRRRNIKVDAATRHEKSLRRYLNRLYANAERLPGRAGQPNRRAISKACNFHPDAFYAYPSLARVLEEFDNRTRELGFSTREPGGLVLRQRRCKTSD